MAQEWAGGGFVFCGVKLGLCDPDYGRVQGAERVEDTELLGAGRSKAVDIGEDQAGRCFRFWEDHRVTPGHDGGSGGKRLSRNLKFRSQSQCLLPLGARGGQG